MRAWFAGDFDGCLARCDRVRPSDVDMVSQLALLRARALLRLGRADDAIGAVRSVFIAHGTLDASLTARMLLGTAYVRRGDNRTGLHMLEHAYAGAGGAHPTVRSEIALNIALAYYGLRELDGADRALDRVSPDADIVHARALEYRAWIALARSDFAGAMRHFQGALLRLDGCRHYDRFLEANSLQGLAMLAAERLDRAAFMLVEQRAERFDGSAGGLAGPLFLVAFAASMMDEVNGRARDALRRAREAETAAPTEIMRLLAMCRRATVLRNVDERHAHYDLVVQIHNALSGLDLSGADGNEREVPAALAIELAWSGDVLGARALLKQYDALPPADAMSSLHDDPRPVGARLYAEAVVADAAGDHQTAHHRYREAFQIFHRCGYERRALHAALRLGELTGQTYLLEYAERVLKKLSAHSPLRQRARRHNAPDGDPVVGALSRTERAVLQLLCEGKSTAEIALLRNRSKQTVRNTVSRILSAFEVGDRHALLRECVKRGIVTG
ncbi:MAG: response regulator transcription factor [Candidatus Eremiobacteraeota bacterium]|nr:response regulator transcription factor [Candidatus Eremiobacteraeota bacterium]